ncbi:MAG: helix-turn-helix transcriptional regulator [bacterium]|nr:helix-turn-helix transcriptional regulator [bacterium]
MSIRLIVDNISVTDNLKMNNEYLQKFAKNLKELRKQNGIKQDDFLNIDGISRSTIAMVETAKTDITLSKIKIIADVIGVKPKDLLDFE